jgi:hypothetical protein
VRKWGLFTRNIHIMTKTQTLFHLCSYCPEKLLENSHDNIHNSRPKKYVNKKESNRSGN